MKKESEVVSVVTCGRYCSICLFRRDGGEEDVSSSPKKFQLVDFCPDVVDDEEEVYIYDVLSLSPTSLLITSSTPPYVAYCVRFDENTSNPELDAKLIGHTTALRRATLCGRRAELVGTSSAGNVRLWNRDDKSLVGAIETMGQINDVISFDNGAMLAFAGTASRTTAVAGSGCVEIWDCSRVEGPPLSSITLDKSLGDPQLGHFSNVGFEMDFDETKGLLFASHGPTVSLWDVRQLPSQHVTSLLHPTYVRSPVLAAPRNDLLFVGVSFGEIAVWDVRNIQDQPMGVLKVQDGDFVHRIVAREDGEVFVSCSGAVFGDVVAFRRDGKVLHRMKAPGRSWGATWWNKE